MLQRKHKPTNELCNGKTINVVLEQAQHKQPVQSKKQARSLEFLI